MSDKPGARKWTDVRIDAAMLGYAMKAIGDTFAPVTLEVDFKPPASGPEYEISVCERTEAEVTAALEEVGITPLAIRSSLRPPRSTVVRPTVYLPAP